MKGKSGLHSADSAILSKIVSYLPPASMAEVGAVDKAFSAASKNNTNWAANLRIHFPQAYQTIIKENRGKNIEVDYYAEFQKQYEDEYSGLTQQEKEFFSLIKESNEKGIKKKLATIKDLKGLKILTIKSKNDQMLNLINKKGVSDVIFEKILELYNPVNIATDKSQILTPNVDVNKIDENGRNILDWAVLFHQPSDFIFQLISEHPNLIERIGQRGVTALTRAAGCGNLEATDALLDRMKTHLKGQDQKRLALINQKDCAGQSPLYHACATGHSEIVKLLLENGADINSTRNCEEGPTPLHAAIRGGHLDVVNVLLDSNVNINHDIRYQYYNPIVFLLLGSLSPRPLALAAKHGHVDIVKRLLEHGAEFYPPDSCRVSPWYLAAEAGHTEVMKLLLNNAPNQFIHFPVSPMCIAAENGHCDIVKLLIEKDIACLNYGNTHGKYGRHMTPLHYAVLHGQVEVIKLLLNNNANINARTTNGTTPLDLAKKSKNKEIIKLLYKLKLIEYINNRTVDQREYKRYLFFGRWVVGLGYSRGQKISAATTLLTAISNENPNPIELSQIPALQQGELSKIYKQLK
jgi:ankyrin repeat protein